MFNEHKHRKIPFLIVLTSVMLATIVTRSQAAWGDQPVQARMTLAQLEPPRQETLPPPEDQRCAAYAHNALADYETMRRFPQCAIPDSPRWQSNYRNHYGWCLTARPEWLASENGARENHLKRCGARYSY